MFQVGDTVVLSEFGKTHGIKPEYHDYIFEIVAATGAYVLRIFNPKPIHYGQPVHVFEREIMPYDSSLTSNKTTMRPPVMLPAHKSSIVFPKTKCECGCSAVGSSNHSDYCPLYGIA